MKKNKTDLLEAETKVEKQKKQIAIFYEKHLTKKRYEDLKDCGNYLEFATDMKKENKKTIRANYCNNRWCPVCNRNKAAKDALNLAIITKAIKDIEDYDMLFTTFTIKNVKGSELGKTLDRMQLAFKRMQQRDPMFKKLVAGTFRKIEITYNRKTNTYHPHIHALLAVEKLATGTGRNRITKPKALKSWQHYYKDNTITQVDVKKPKGDTVAVELTKYLTKYSEIKNQQVFDTLVEAVGRKRLTTKSGIFKEYFTDLYNNPKSFLPYMQLDTNEYIYKLVAIWNYDMNFYERTYTELTDEEYYKVNNSLQYKLDRIETKRAFESGKRKLEAQQIKKALQRQNV